MLKHYDRERLIWESSLKSNKKLLLLALNSFVDANGECWPGQELLARMAGFSDRTIRNLCTELESEKIIQRSRRFDNEGHRTSDKYKLNFDQIPTGKSRQSLPEKFSGSTDPYRKIATSLPENRDIPTGKSRQSLPEKFSGDLSSKNYPENYPERKESAVTVDAIGTSSSFLEENSQSESDNPKFSSPVNPESQSMTNQQVANTSVEDQSSAKFSPENKPVDAFAESAKAARAGKHHCPYQILNDYGWVEGLWVGPKSYHWDQRAIAKAQDYKRSINQDDSVGAAQTFLINMVAEAQRSGIVAKLEKFRDELLNQSSLDFEGLDAALGKELKRLGLTCELPPAWQEATGVTATIQLNVEQKRRYLLELQSREVVYAG